MLRAMMIALAVTALVHGSTAQADCGASHERASAHDSYDKDIVDTAVAAGSFNTLVTAVEAAGLVEVLKSDGPFTVFAPTDEAFAKLPKGTVESLLDDPETLRAVLTYHVVPGKVKAADVLGLDWARTVQGQSLRVQVADGSVMIDGAKVISTDIHTANGVIHVIDTVVLPRKDIVATAQAAGSFQTLAKALDAAGLVETLRGEGPFTVFAPTDAAFAALPDGTIEALLGNVPQLQGVLTYHVVPGRVLSSDLAAQGKNRFEVETAQGGKLMVSIEGDGSIMVNDAKVTGTDIIAGNGVIHVIDAVVMPKSSS